MNADILLKRKAGLYITGDRRFFIQRYGSRWVIQPVSTEDEAAWEAARIGFPGRGTQTLREAQGWLFQSVYDHLRA